jgi:hypothetical protein
MKTVIKAAQEAPHIEKINISGLGKFTEKLQPLAEHFNPILPKTDKTAPNLPGTII